MRDEDEHGENRADREERRLEPDQADDRGRDERADRRRAHREAPGHAEHAGQHVVGNRALEEREPGDVDDAVRGADHREQDDHGRGVGERRHQHDRDAPEDEGPGERRREPLAAQRDRAERADQAPGSDRGRQVSDLRRALVEHLVGGDDDQHVQAPAHERLRGDEAHEEPRARDLADRLEALPDLDCATRSQAPGGRPGPRHEREQCGRDEQRRRAGREDRRDVGERDQHAGGERAEQRAEALDRRGRSVRSDQLPRRARQRWEQRDESRPEQRRADADRRPGGEDDDAVVHQRLPRPRRRARPLRASTIPSRNRSRRKRSPRDDANGAIAAAGSRRTRPAIPTAVDPPWL